jgi:hypothetical protein
MYHYTNTILNQLLTFLPKQQFDHFVGQHNGDRYVKKLTTWNQLVVLLYAQATGKESLREIETSLTAQQGIWYHLGIKGIARSSLADANKRRDAVIFEKLFYALLTQCQEVTHTTTFSFKNPLYALDATTIQLCLSLFNWAKYTKTKGALKLHTLLNVRTTIPELITITDGKVGDVTAGKLMALTTRLENGSILVFDRAYVDYAWWHALHKKGITFVSRIKSNMHIDVIGQHAPPTPVSTDERVLIGEYKGMTTYPETLRRVRIIDTMTGEVREYLTNNMTYTKEQIDEIYRARWQIEVFFKWIKQNLKIKTFLGSSQNAVMSQIWIAMIYYLLLAYIKFQTKFPHSLLEFTRMVRETLLIRRPLIDLLSLTARTVRRMHDPTLLQLTLL